MRIVKGLLPHETPDGVIAVATGEAANRFNGMLRLNPTAVFVLERLAHDTTEEEIVSALLSEYDVTEEVAKRDVSSLIGQLRAANLIIE